MNKSIKKALAHKARQQESPPPTQKPKGHVGVSDLDIQAQLRFREQLKLQTQGKYRCMECNKIGPQSEALVTSFLGNILMALCPGCIKGPVVVQRQGNNLLVQHMRPNTEKRIIPATQMPRNPDLNIAKPQVEKIKL